MKSLRIAVDCDDVIVPTAELIIRHYNQAYGTQLALADIYSTNLELWGVGDKAVAVQRVEAYMKTKEYQQAQPFQEAIEAIRILSRYHELHVVTGRADFLAQATTDMLSEYFPDIFQGIEFTNFFGKAYRSKSQVCQELGADLLIDDHMHHAEVVAQCGMDVLLFGRYPWNEGDIALPNIRRVKNWNEVLERLVG